MYKKIIILSSILLLVIGCIYFYNISTKLDYTISIRVPVKCNSSTIGIDYCEPLTDREEAQEIIAALMKGVTIEKPSECNKLPNIHIQFSDWNNGVTWHEVDVWSNNNIVILESINNSDEVEYKVVDWYSAAALKTIIEKYGIRKIYPN